MNKYISKDALLAEMESLRCSTFTDFGEGFNAAVQTILKVIDALEVKDPYEQCVQYDSIKAGIQAHAKTYSFNIQSELFNQLTKEQQALWRKEIEQAVISGGDAGYLLAKDPRYKENLEVKGVDLEKNVEESIDGMGKFNEKIYEDGITWLFGHHCLECEHLTFAQHEVKKLAKYFYELSYHQAEKDVALTWEDVRKIYCLTLNIKEHLGSSVFGEPLYKEVLKRFKAQKGE